MVIGNERNPFPQFNYLFVKEPNITQKGEDIGNFNI